VTLDVDIVVDIDIVADDVEDNVADDVEDFEDNWKILLMTLHLLLLAAVCLSV
jgi:hypothetical protein